MPISKTKTLKSTKAGDFNQFRMSILSGSVRERAKFDPQRRQAVKEVRKMRACLRCSLSKIKCSSGNPCTTCEQLAFVLHTAYQKQTLPFSGCIRTKLHEVSVFEAYIPPPDVQRFVQAKSKNLALTTISLDFASQVKWDLRALVNDIVNWLNDSMVPATSKVGTLSSPQFSDLIKSSIKENTRMNFQRMIYAISLVYTQPSSLNRDHLSIEELYQIGCVAGHGLLKELDDKLKPQALNCYSDDDLRALFLLVFGSILAVSYTQPEFSLKPTPEQHNQFKDMQYHLCQILAHYIIYLGLRLNLPIANGADEFILKEAPARWHKEGGFQWRTPHDNESALDTEDEMMFSNLNDSFPGNRIGLDSGFRSLRSKISRRRGPLEISPIIKARRSLACVKCWTAVSNCSLQTICNSCMKKLTPVTSLVWPQPKYLMREQQLYADHVPTSRHPPAQVIDQRLPFSSGNDGFVPFTEIHANKADLGSVVGIELKKQRQTSLPQVPLDNDTTAISAVLQHQITLKARDRSIYEPLDDLHSRLPNHKVLQTYNSCLGYDDRTAVRPSDPDFSNLPSAYQHDLVQQKHLLCSNCCTLLSSGHSRVDEMYLSLSDDLPERDTSVQNASSELCLSMELDPEQSASI